VRGRRRCLSVASHRQIAKTFPISSESRKGPLNPSFSPHAGRRSRERRGESKGTRALVLATQPHPSFADQSHECFASKKIRGGGAPKRRNCPVGPRHAADVATSMRFGRRPRVQRNALAFRRSTAVLTAAPKRRSSVQAALHAMQCAGVICALASRLSEAPRAPVVMPAGSMPGPPESGSDEPPPAGTAPAPSVGVTG
jgi:hypothetical protein